MAVPISIMSLTGYFLELFSLLKYQSLFIPNLSELMPWLKKISETSNAMNKKCTIRPKVGMRAAAGHQNDESFWGSRRWFLEKLFVSKF